MNKDLIELKAAVVDGLRGVLEGYGAVEAYYPKITQGTGACENVPTAFILKNTKELSFLSQTDQLLMERDILENDLPAVWTIGRSYRNEPRAGDGRHLNEFALLEFEARGMGLTELMDLQAGLLSKAMEVAFRSPLISDKHKAYFDMVRDRDIPCITYAEIFERLSKAGVTIKWGDDFDSRMEEMICGLYGGPVMVTHYPELIKFFNMYRTDREPLPPGMPIGAYNELRLTVDCVDFLLPWAGETFGGSRREEDYHTLTLKLKESRMFKQMVDLRASEQIPIRMMQDIREDAWKPFIPYLELFNPETHPDRKSVMRSGFGLGMGRLMQFLLGANEVVEF